MFTLKNQEQLAKAINKARALKPRLSVNFFGSYTVKGSKGDAYTVACGRDENGAKYVACDCKGGERGLVCYHAAAAVGLHVVIAGDNKHPFRQAIG